MARRTVTAGTGAYDPAVVDFWSEDGGAMFETCEMVKSRMTLFDELQEKAAAVDADPDSGVDDYVAVLGDIFDILMKPDGHRRKASAIVKQRWDDNKVTVIRLEELVSEIGDASRPT
jgi:hypothetical protein